VTTLVQYKGPDDFTAKPGRSRQLLTDALMVQRQGTTVDTFGVYVVDGWVEFWPGSPWPGGASLDPGLSRMGVERGRWTGHVAWVDSERYSLRGRALPLAMVSKGRQGSGWWSAHLVDRIQSTSEHFLVHLEKNSEVLTMRQVTAGEREIGIPERTVDAALWARRLAREWERAVAPILRLRGDCTVGPWRGDPALQTWDVIRAVGLEGTPANAGIPSACVKPWRKGHLQAELPRTAPRAAVLLEPHCGHGALDDYCQSESTGFDRGIIAGPS